MMVQLEDALGEIEQANLPGTTDEHPNWRRKLRGLDAMAGDARDRASLPRCARPGRAAAGESPRAGREARVPRATYRLQLHRDFDFDDGARASCPTSPGSASATSTARRSRARDRGSMHGYDVVAHDEINPELGGADGLRALRRRARARTASAC